MKSVMQGQSVLKYKNLVLKTKKCQGADSDLKNCAIAMQLGASVKKSKKQSIHVNVSS